MQKFSTAPIEAMRSFVQHRELIYGAVKREIESRYRGSVLGLAWSFVYPLLMLAIYTFVFSEIFKAKWNTATESKSEFALVLFAGLIVYTLFTETITRAPGLILSNVNYVKKIVFPIEILPWISIASSLFHALVSLSVWLLAYLIYFGAPPTTALLLPIVWLPMLLFVNGLSWFLASLGVYLRDVSQIIGICMTALMFLSPIFYPASAIPERYRFLLFFNPLTPAVELTRDVLYWGKLPDLLTLACCWGVSLLTVWLGFAWFQKTRAGFADVL